MRHLAWTLLIAACSASDGPIKSLDFGPFEVAAGQEITQDCVQITLHNNDYLYVNEVELTTGPGFHHSNWLFVPEHIFPGTDGTFRCRDRNFDQAVAAISGGVLYAQSTQNPHEIQAFPPGVVVKIPPGSKLVSTIHLLNPSDAKLTLRPNITLTTIPERDVTTVLAGIAFQNMALALPAGQQSRFTVECEIATKHTEVFGRAPDFNIYYALAHYHELGIGLTIEAVKQDNTAATIYTTQTAVGDSLGGAIDPTFSLSGYTKLRLSCDYYNPRAEVVRWGVGDQEMCVFLAFSDSTYIWGGGVLDEQEPLNGVQVGTAWHFSNPCTLFASDASR